jgi:BirA family biotin operon repressor/biotin-[acetyl-CoA-carboxylase] ligase
VVPAKGRLVLADRQTAGRGRWGRVWVSPRGGLWYSLVLRPSIAPDRCPALTLVAALDWVRVLRRRGLDARVKWPNDVWVGENKVAGILTEMSAETDRVHWVVMGVGVNVNNRPPASTDAASVSQWTGPVSRQELLSDWLTRFVRSYGRFVRNGFGPFQRDFNRWSVLNGRKVRLEGTISMEGQVLGVDDFGRLRLMTARGEKTCVGGEVSVARRHA